MIDLMGTKVSCIWHVLLAFKTNKNGVAELQKNMTQSLMALIRNVVNSYDSLFEYGNKILYFSLTQ